MSLPLGNASLAALAAWILYLLFGAIYRLYFHPLAKFPGPKLAALSGWYEFYHDVVQHGLFIWKIQELHDKYGRQPRPLGKTSASNLTETHLLPKQDPLSESTPTRFTFVIQISTKSSMPPRLKSGTNMQTGRPLLARRHRVSQPYLTTSTV
jgi:hypothetical protein